MAHQVSSTQVQESVPFVPSIQNHSNFTFEQYQQWLALIGTPSSRLGSTFQGKEVPMANVVASSSIAITGIDLTHSIFCVQVVNRRAYCNNTWVMDTSATNHIMCFVHLLTTIAATTQSMVQFHNGETAKVTHVGTVVLSSFFTLTNVLCVPSFIVNLLSISTITQSQPYCLVFLSSYCFIQDLTSWRMIRVRQALDGLYLLQCESLQHTSSYSLADFLVAHKLGTVFHPFSAAVSQCNSSFLWHARLGHPFDPKLHALSHVIPYL